jgi:hypothetical protein
VLAVTLFIAACGKEQAEPPADVADHYIAYSTEEYYMRELILVIASVSIILWEPVFAAPEIAEGLLH